MMPTQANLIPEIRYPIEHLEALKRLNPLLIEALKRDGPPIESGEINLGRIDKDLRLPLFFFSWTVEINTVIDNLNIVLTDLRELPEKYEDVPGSPRKRFYLLVRMYFYEFYRFREIFNEAMKGLLRGGYISKSWVHEFRKTFDGAFEPTMEVRHTLVHRSPTWKGEKHFNLLLVGMAFERGIAPKSKQTGRIWALSDVLKDICEPMADTMRDEGMRMSNTLQTVVDEFVKITSGS